MNGSVTLSLPAAFGKLSAPTTSATQTIASPLNPGTNGTASWKVNATGAVGSYTLNYTLVYKGYKNTTYTARSAVSIAIKAAPSSGFDPMLIVIIGEAVVAVALVVLLVTSLRKGGGKSGKRLK
jgi:hypothetical protein